MLQAIMFCGAIKIKNGKIMIKKECLV